MNVTIKEFPPDLHARLKAAAEENGRSLTRQIVHLLETAGAPKRTDDSLLLQRIKKNRREMTGRIDQDFLNAAIDDGRS